jgi:hypothetical protein
MYEVDAWAYGGNFIRPSVLMFHLSKDWTDSAYVGFEVLTAVIIKSTVFWDTTPCSPWKSTDVSEKYIASIFRVEEYAKLEISVIASGKQRRDIPPNRQLTSQKVVLSIQLELKFGSTAAIRCHLKCF